ncbi:MAG: GntR family transcriptional regulator [Eubacterium sp.]|jgi:GntR family transcriptional regulator|nr:GntR family transcriptional regulator [Eubacterium sp.]
MLIFINNKNGVPIYDQIYSQIKAQIINGTLEEDAPLPSIRNLAKDLHISVITTKRAYEELERNGLIYTAPGKGSFVAVKNTELLREENLRQIEAHLDEVMKLSASCNLTKKDIISMLDILFEEE